MFKKLSAFVHSLVHAHHARRDPEMGMLKAENRMVRHRLSGKYIVPSDAERRELMAWGAKLNHEVDGILSCVHRDLQALGPRRGTRKDARSSGTQAHRRRSRGTGPFHWSGDIFL